MQPKSNQQSQQPKQPANGKRYLNIKPEDQAKIDRRLKRNQEKQSHVDPEWAIIAEFGLMYGYEAIEAVFDNRIDLDRVMILIEAGRKVQNRHVIDAAYANFIGAGAAQSGKKAGTVFQKGMRGYQKAAEVKA